MRTVVAIALGFVSLLAVIAADAPSKPVEKAIDAQHMQYWREVLKEEVEKVNLKLRVWRLEICMDVGLKDEDCNVNPQTGKVSKNELPPVPKPPDPPKK